MGTNPNKQIMSNSMDLERQKEKQKAKTNV